MKKWIALLLALCLMLCGCGAPVETEPSTVATEPTTEPTAANTTEPAPVYHNPLTGEQIGEPLTTRVFAVSINNLQHALPHYGVKDADIFMEMFVNGSIIRGLALYADAASVPAIGSVRSTRYMFTDIAPHYDAIVAHAGGSQMVLDDIRDSGVDGFNIDTASETAYSFRDMERINSGIGWEHSLFAIGEGLADKAVEQGIDVSQDPDKDYGMTFVEDGTPEGGETANSVTVTITFGSRKKTTMVYDEELGKYIYHQYGQKMLDGPTGEPEAFENVVIMLSDIYMNEYGYHCADFEAGGTGYFACGGKIIPILWTCGGVDQPFLFTTTEGEPLDFGVGSTYMAIAHVDSPVTYE